MGASDIEAISENSNDPVRKARVPRTGHEGKVKNNDPE
jgi:hypothetical protein